MKPILFTLLLSLSATFASAQKQIYAFACAEDFSDSVVYITSIRPLPAGAKLTRGFLEHRMQWSYQFENYIERTFPVSNATATIFYSKSKKKIAKQLEKVKKTINKEFNKTINVVKDDEFVFTPIQ